jgi:hypothetical protein
MGKKRWYFPGIEAEVVPWSKNFVSVLTLNAGRWGISSASVTGLAALDTAYAEAFARRKLPDAGKVTTEQKTMALDALKQGVKDMVNGHINHNPDVTPDDRLALGLHVYSERAPISAPTTTVVLRIAMGLVRQLLVYFSDSATPDRRGKPYGAETMVLACAVLDSPPKDPSELIRIVTSSKSPLALNFREEDRGKTVYMAGRWKTARQLEGPQSGIISAVIP